MIHHCNDFIMKWLCHISNTVSDQPDGFCSKALVIRLTTSPLSAYCRTRNASTHQRGGSDIINFDLPPTLAYYIPPAGKALNQPQHISGPTVMVPCFRNLPVQAFGAKIGIILAARQCRFAVHRALCQRTRSRFLASGQ